MWGPSPAAADPIFPGKKWRPFLVITVAFIHFNRSLECRPLFPARCYVAKNCRSSCGGLFFVGAPLRSNMLNMPKSVAAFYPLFKAFQRGVM